jgi:pimeloyl-ACP methyl ester carboxylesterase
LPVDELRGDAAPDRRLVIRSWGDAGAPVVVFLHGLGLLGPLLTDEAAEAWAARGFRVLAPNLPGFGGSAAVSRDDYRPSRLAELLLLELPDRFALVGFSWGGTIGCHVVAQAPERVVALALVDVGYQTPPSDPAPYEQQLEEARAESEEMRYADADAFLAAARPHFSPRVTDAQLLASVREEAGELVPELTPEVYASALHGVELEPPQRLLGALGEARLPVLLLAAGQPESDQRAAEVEAFEQAVPQATVRHFPEAGHNVLFDAADEAIPGVGDWLRRSLR